MRKHHERVLLVDRSLSPAAIGRYFELATLADNLVLYAVGYATEPPDMSGVGLSDKGCKLLATTEGLDHCRDWIWHFDQALILFRSFRNDLLVRQRVVMPAELQAGTDGVSRAIESLVRLLND